MITVRILKLIAVLLGALLALAVGLALFVRSSGIHVRASLMDQQRSLNAAFMSVHARSLVEQLRTEGRPYPTANRVYESLQRCDFSKAHHFDHPALPWVDAQVFDTALKNLGTPDAPERVGYGPREREFMAHVNSLMKARPPHFFDGALEPEDRWFSLDHQTQALDIEAAGVIVACDALVTSSSRPGN